MTRTLLLSLLLSTALLPSACGPEKPDDTGPAEEEDADADGYPAGVDCDDGSATVHPGAEERCNGVDDDCDGAVDEEDAVDPLTWYADADADGWGDATSTTQACAQPSGFVVEPGDCDDGDSAAHPGLDELCNGKDDDCDGATDEPDAADAQTWYADADADGWGDATSTTQACAQPSGFVADPGDCDDGDSAAHPGLDELCNGKDDDCDGDTDEPDAADAQTWYADADADGWGDAANATLACLPPSGFVADATDCDDGTSTTSPGATEYCDGEDNDCDGTVDEDDAADAEVWYADTDGDGFGDLATPTLACAQPTGFLSDATDCDDADAEVHPGHDELCDGKDDDCDGDVDEPDAVDALTWYADSDGDGYGDVAVVTPACSQPSGHLADATDCDDAEPSTYPGAEERCDGHDDDCDGVVDEPDAVDALTWYDDADGDGYGDLAAPTPACTQPAGFVDLAQATDCDDDDPDAWPGAVEYCDGHDDDCDGTVDEPAAVDAPTWYQDLDGDGHGTDLASSVACTQPSGFVAVDDDCDDADASTSPSAVELCDLVDNDCSGVVDDMERCDAGVELPPDPAAVATSMQASAPTPFGDATAFLYEGDDPVQLDVEEDAIDAVRAAVLRGEVLDRDGLALPGVMVTVPAVPELGYTLTRDDGGWDLAANGGDWITVQFEKDGYLTSQRKVRAPIQDFSLVDDVVLVELPETGAWLDFSGANPFQVVDGDEESDDDGTRRAILMVPAGVTADLVMSDGSTSALPEGTLRIVEYTVGDSGPEAMPGELPASSAYTYAVEFHVDEADALGATTVEFSDALYSWVDNFLGFPVGSAVPSGYYDAGDAAWIPEENGVVVEVLSVASGLAELDVDGSGYAADAADLAALDITDEERAAIALRASAGDQFWRVPVWHFTSYDWNWPWSWPDGAVPPSGGASSGGSGVSDPCSHCGSIIETENQVLGEQIALEGTPFTLAYKNDRLPGTARNRTVSIQVTDDDVPSGLVSASVTVDIAGRTFTESFGPDPAQTYDFTWDGEDAYGRAVRGAVTAYIDIVYNYGPVFYTTPASFDAAFGGSGDSSGAAGPDTRDEAEFVQRLTATLNGWDARNVGFGGWSLDVHHVYDPVSRTLLMGNGTERSAEELGWVIDHFAGNGDCSGGGGDGGDALDAGFCTTTGTGLVVAPDSTVYLADWYHQNIRKIDPDGTITTWMGSGGTISGALPRGAVGLALDASGNMYIAEEGNNLVEKVTPAGTVTTVAGDGTWVYDGDGQPATDAALYQPQSVAVDAEGNVYIGEGEHAGMGGHRVRKVDTAGIITTVAGRSDSCWSSYPFVDGSAVGATGNCLYHDVTGLALDAEGNLLLADGGISRSFIREVTPDGRMWAFSGDMTTMDAQDGVPATDTYIACTDDVVVAETGTVYYTDWCEGAVRKVTSDGIISTIAGIWGSPVTPSAGGLVALRAYLGYPTALASMPDGSLLVASWNKLYHIHPPFPDFDAEDILVASEDGREVYHFDSSGLHLETLDLLTGAVLYSFTYDEDGYLASVTDRNGLETTFERSEITLIDVPRLMHVDVTGPFGAESRLYVDSDGYLYDVRDPGGADTTLSYVDDGGLLASMTDAEGGTTSFTWDDDGRLLSETQPRGNTRTLSRTGDSEDYAVTWTTDLGHSTTYAVSSLTEGGTSETITDPVGLTSLREVYADDTTLDVAADGTTVETASDPDPIFGMQAPVRSTTVTTPGGISTEVSVARDAELLDDDDPTLVDAWSETTTVDGYDYVTTWDPADLTLYGETPTGVTWSETRDEDGNVVSVAVGDLDPVDLTRDGDGLVTAMTQGSATWSMGYGSDGYLASTTDPMGETVSYTRDANGRVTAREEPDGSTTGFVYDDVGRVTALTTPAGNVHGFTYDAAGNLTAYTPPAAGIPSPETSYTWDDDDRLSQVDLPGGEVVTIAYDAAGRLTRVEDDHDTRTMSYDATGGQLTALTSDDVTLAYTWDGPLPLSETWSGLVSGNVDYTWDTGFLPASISAGGIDVDYAYDADKTLVGAGDLTVGRDAITGLPTDAALGSLDTAWAYDSRGFLASEEHSFGGAVVARFDYTRDALGRITERYEEVDGTVHTWAYVYDSLGRLETVDLDGAAYADYSYDADGNRTSISDPSVAATATFDAQDRMLSQGSTTFTWNDDGTLASQTDASGTTTYDYDAGGGLRSATLPDGTLLEYVIDGLGRRVGKLVDGALEQAFLYSGQLQIVAELDGSGALVSRFVYAGSGNVPAYMIQGSHTYRLITDQVGSVRLVVDADTGVVAQEIEYGPWGEVLSDSSPGFQPFGFAGGVYDRDTGLVRFGARDYCSFRANWSSADIVSTRTVQETAYQYCEGDPINSIDTAGRAGVQVFASGVGGVPPVNPTPPQGPTDAPGGPGGPPEDPSPPDGGGYEPDLKPTPPGGRNNDDCPEDDPYERWKRWNDLVNRYLVPVGVVVGLVGMVYITKGGILIAAPAFL
ncbi:MAG: MopE-related protein [Pseudomonadota bacterium]